MLYINGKWIEGSGPRFASANPATGASIWEGREAGSSDIAAAVAGAEIAQIRWHKFPLEERIARLQSYARLVVEKCDEFARIISEEMGKPLWEAKTEVSAVANKVDISIRAHQERSSCLQIRSGPLTISTRHKPHGVVAVFGPFNFPAHLPNGHIIPLLLAGNAILFKPSELTPKVAEFMTTLFHEAGIPSGIVQLLQGGRNCGKLLADVKNLRGIFFTGSYQVGQLLAEKSLVFPGRIVALEMGGNNPLVIARNQNIDAEVISIIQSAFITSGQRCSCARRLIIVENNMTGTLIRQLAETTENLAIGAYTEMPEPFMGPVIHERAANELLSAFSEIEKLGGRPILPMRRISSKGPACISPGIIDTTDVSVEDVEFFGPLLQVKRVADLDAAIAEANRTEFGLTAAILTDNKREYEEFFDRVHAGIINWNMPTTGASSNAPFGGIGKSGNFRPSGFYACDYSSYPIASQEHEIVTMPEKIPPGIIYPRGSK